jgi:hypothetical protein
LKNPIFVREVIVVQDEIYGKQQLLPALEQKEARRPKDKEPKEED